MGHYFLDMQYLDIDIGAGNMEPDLAPLAADGGAVQPHVLAAPPARNKPNRGHSLKSAIFLSEKIPVLPSIMYSLA